MDEPDQRGGHTRQASGKHQGIYAGKTYEIRLLIAGEQTSITEYQIPAGDTIPDSGMEDPALSCFTIRNENAEFWASGNNTFAEKLCTQGTFNGMGGSHCAMLKAASPAIVDLAAGNLMSGIFYKDGLTTASWSSGSLTTGRHAPRA